jgi:hypothetical protein
MNLVEFVRLAYFRLLSVLLCMLNNKQSALSGSVYRLDT